MEKQKRISILIVIIIAVVMVILFGRVFLNQYFVASQELNSAKLPEQIQQPSQKVEVVKQTNSAVVWNTYSDNNYNYSIEYPANWYLEKNSNNSGKVYNLIFSNLPRDVEADPPKDLYLFGINVYDIDSQTTYNDILEKYRPYNYTEEQNVQIDGVKSIKLTKTTDEYLIKSTNRYKSTNTYIFTKNDSTLFVFLYSHENPYSGDPVGQDKLDLAEKIISTFKFKK